MPIKSLVCVHHRLTDPACFRLDNREEGGKYAGKYLVNYNSILAYGKLLAVQPVLKSQHKVLIAYGEYLTGGGWYYQGKYTLGSACEPWLTRFFEKRTSMLWQLGTINCSYLNVPLAEFTPDFDWTQTEHLDGYYQRLGKEATCVHPYGITMGGSAAFGPAGIDYPPDFVKQRGRRESPEYSDFFPFLLGGIDYATPSGVPRIVDPEHASLPRFLEKLEIKLGLQLYDFYSKLVNRDSTIPKWFAFSEYRRHVGFPTFTLSEFVRQPYKGFDPGIAEISTWPPRVSGNRYLEKFELSLYLTNPSRFSEILEKGRKIERATKLQLDYWGYVPPGYSQVEAVKDFTRDTGEWDDRLPAYSAEDYSVQMDQKGKANILTLRRHDDFDMLANLHPQALFSGLVLRKDLPAREQLIESIIRKMSKLNAVLLLDNAAEVYSMAGFLQLPFTELQLVWLNLYFLERECRDEEELVLKNDPITSFEERKTFPDWVVKELSLYFEFPLLYISWLNKLIELHPAFSNFLTFLLAEFGFLVRDQVIGQLAQTVAELPADNRLIEKYTRDLFWQMSEERKKR